MLDADFVPRPDMLSELAPYFDDPTVGIVQSPQCSTPTPRCPGCSAAPARRRSSSTGWIQPSRDSVGGRDLRRHQRALPPRGPAALRRLRPDQPLRGRPHRRPDAAGRDCRLRYVPVLVSKGLCPDTASAFLNQQYRWCTGSMSLLADRGFHEARQITKRQRLCFWAGFLYYISTAVNALVAPLPAIAMLWLVPAWVEPMNSVWLFGALLLWFVVLPMRDARALADRGAAGSAPLLLRPPDRDLAPAPGPDPRVGGHRLLRGRVVHPARGLDRAGLQDLRRSSRSW